MDTSIINLGGYIMKLGFACLWNEDKKKTWSYTPWNLRKSLSNITKIVDVGIEYNKYFLKFLKLINIKYKYGHLCSDWEFSSFTDRINQHMLKSNLHGVDALLEIGDLSITDKPYYLYQDCCCAFLLDCLERGMTLEIMGFGSLSKDLLLRRHEREMKVYEKMSGLFSMNNWLAEYLNKKLNIDKDKIHPVYAGINSVSKVPIVKKDNRSERNKLLFLGVDFFRKGGDIVLEAVDICRKEIDPDVTLTVIGPKKWPLKTEIPDYVKFLGRLSTDAVASIIDEHDLLVMPSRFEAFGIAFLEALSRGIPCIGRNAFAMPEFIIPGKNGDLIDNDDSHKLAEIIYNVLKNDEIYDYTFNDVDNIINKYSWDRVAKDIYSAISMNLM